MKTEAQVKVELELAKRDLARTKKQFEKYDNYEDMDKIERLKAYVDALEFVLS